MAASLLGYGSFAHVFDMGDGTVVKAYFRQRHASRPVEDWRDHDRITRLLWKTEADTYEHLQTFPHLTRFIPTFHGTVDPESIALPAERPKGPHIPGCGLRLEKLPGTDRKLGQLEPDVLTVAEQVLRQIAETNAAINVWDCSCFAPGPRGPLALIDFAISDHYGELVDILERLGALPEHTIGLLRLV